MTRDIARRRAGAARICAGIALLTATGLAPDDAQAASENELAASRAVVEELHERLIDAMKAGSEWSFEERRDQLDPVLRQSFDFGFMAEKATGRHWAQLDAAQRERLIETMGDLAAANYAARFHTYQGEQFETTGSEAATHSTVLVRTVLTRTDGEPVALDYRMRPDAAGQPRIVDIFLNGTVSELALRRAEYSSVMQREGFDALLSGLREKVAAQPTAEP